MQQAEGHAHHAHRADPGGMVMNENRDRLPRDCPEISTDVAIEVNAGAKFASDFPGAIFAFDQQQMSVPPCSRVTVTFHNQDQVRHQWMLHGLPRYLYPGGMFHIEANGGETVSGQFIVPSDNKTYLVHCDITQHMEKGMKAQLLVGEGSGDLWSVPGVSANFRPEDYLPSSVAIWMVVAVIAGGLLARLLTKRHGRR